MHAIVEFQGRQFRVRAGEKILVPRLEAEPGSRVQIERVLMISGENGIQVGRPWIPGAHVEATVVGPVRGPKIIVGKYKKRKDYRRRKGYRDDLTQVEIGAILGA